MRVLMIGWELPPYNSGGLGVACYGLSKSLSKDNDILFVLPHKIDVDMKFLKLLFADSKVHFADESFYPSAYITPEEYKKLKNDISLYGANLFEEVESFAKEARNIAAKEEFDVIHAHDWLSMQAGIAAKDISHKPLIVHVHSTEIDRTGGNNVNNEVYEIEKEGLKKADKIIAVSNFTKKIITDNYGIDEKKITVIHNRINADEYKEQDVDDAIFSIKKGGKKIVLFVGRITLQKGPEYFLKVAKRVLEFDKNVLFVMAGSGDMHRMMINEVAAMGISDRVLFTGFLRGKELSNVFKMADLFVMPSVSEPFSLVTLESIIHDTPVLISKQSGVSEVLKNALKVDFWDIDEMTNKILSVLQHSSLKACLLKNSKKEVENFSWDMAAGECSRLYSSLIK